MGRVCYHPCTSVCNRAQLDEAVGINSVERFLGDEAIRRGWRPVIDAEPSGKRVLVVGAGPSGLSAAYHLAMLGHEVVIRDSGERPGGMMRFGIPAYRLPRDVLEAEVQRILDRGSPWKGAARSPTSRRRSPRARSTRRSWRWVRRSAGAHTSRREMLRTSSTRSRCCTMWRRGNSRCWAVGWPCTAAGIPLWMRHAPPGGSAPRTRSWSTGAIASGCPPMTPRCAKRSRRA